jgi:Asp-tRNA(Asn)/Glu-tRNA(Gln) amidotransferase A subunit family amidase
VPDPLLLDATGQAALVRSGEITPAELVDEAISCIERLNPELNAVVIPLFDKARTEANTTPDGPFRGVPYLLKDLALVSKGDPTCHSIAGVKASGYRADHDSFYVERMRRAGFVLLGKTNLDELGMGASTGPVAWGQTRNPWDTSRSPGGSSGGSAAAVAAGIVAVADATDAAGSIRAPASHCGVAGFKASRGRVSVGPDVFADNLLGIAAELCVARTVRDVAGVLDVVSGHRPGDPYCAPPPRRPFVAEVSTDPGRLRIGVLTTDPTGRTTIDSACAAGTRAVADALADLGHDVEDSHPAALSDGGFPEPFMSAMAVVTTRSLDLWSQRLGRPLTEDDVEPRTWAASQFGSTVTGTQYADGVDSLRAHGRDIEQWWEDGWDLLLTPTMPTAPPLLGHSGDVDPFTFTAAFNASGQPAVSLPLQSDDGGLPIGIQVVAAYGREDVLLRVASQLESAMPWADRRPPLHVDELQRPGIVLRLPPAAMATTPSAMTRRIDTCESE